MFGGSVRADRGGQRVVQRLGIGADGFDALGRKPLAGFLVEARRVGVVLGAVGVFVVPAGVDDDDVAGPDLRAWRSPSPRR